ncbi:hypothetical protein M2283_005256 [Streptomyces pseudovenezuelae]|uniref:DUF3152 domain-containing protein n=1 Tax=Streptomyces pseudovenezuelae TaxID=67350 RepID=A0ABT6LQ19_9ACTN|nr:hypothetical protein [Streptomyces pseudovenezuelae]
MTAHKEKPPSRRRNGSAHAASRSGRRQLTGGLAALAALGVVGCAVVAWLPADSKRSPAAAGSDASAERTPSARATTEPPKQKTPTKPARPTASAAGKGGGSPSSSGITIPRNGPGTFVTAPGGSERVGKGRALRYKVEVENGIELSGEDTAEQVERILADPRGWTADGHSGFQRVSTGATDFVVKVATPGTVDKVCGEYGLETGGEVNCSVAHNVMVNLKRWEEATPVYAKDVTSYRALIINHEVGHFLGHGHVTCPAKGGPAPAMMQQIKGMHGCTPNVWPYNADGQFITGPAVP